MYTILALAECPLLCDEFKVGELMYLLIFLRFDVNEAVRK